MPELEQDLSPEEQKQAFDMECRKLVEQLKESGEEFAVERSQKGDDELPIVEKDWQVGDIFKDDEGNVRVALLKQTDDPKKASIKRPKLETFAGWQRDYCLRVLPMDDRSMVNFSVEMRKAGIPDSVIRLYELSMQQPK